KVIEPHIHIRVEKNGSTNVPSPAGQKTRSHKPVSETLFDLRVKKVELLDGWILYNDGRTPLAAQGADFRFVLNAGRDSAAPIYIGELDWKNVQFAAKRYVPVPVSISTKFSIQRNAFTLEQAQIVAGRSKADIQAEITDFSEPNWKFKYRAWV